MSDTCPTLSCCPPPVFGFNSNPVQEFENTAQTATAVCPDGFEGDPVEITVAAGAYVRSSQSDANAAALADAQAQANAALVCTPTGGGCDSLVPTMTGYNTPSGLVFNSLAYVDLPGFELWKAYGAGSWKATVPRSPVSLNRIGYKFTAPQVVKSIRLNCTTELTGIPLYVNLFGGADENMFSTTLHLIGSWPGQTLTSGTPLLLTCAANNTGYLAYGITFTPFSGYNWNNTIPNFGFIQIELFNCDDP